jgi:chloramphenicol-sensitive protein RarD
MNAPESPKAAATRSHAHQEHRAGLALGLGAYGLWGVLPIYFKLVKSVASVDIVAHRVLWSLPFLALLILLSKGWDKVRAALARPRTIGILTITALLIGGNWLLYVYAVTAGHILAASFGYYLNPLANVLLGRFVLKEKLGRLQWVAVAVAAAGISVLAAGALSQLWISLTLCITFALYGLLRKVVPADAVTGLAIETALLFPVSVLWLGWHASQGASVMGTSTFLTLMLLAAGVVSTTPLILFTAAAKRLPYSTMGMLQFIAPTLQFLIAVAVYGEPFTAAHAVAFPLIWAAMVLYVFVLMRTPRLPQPPE